MSDVLTAKALAARWGTTEAALSQRRVRGDGPPFIRLGKRTVRYRLADVLAFEGANRYSDTDTKAPAGPEAA